MSQNRSRSRQRPIAGSKMFLSKEAQKATQALAIYGKRNSWAGKDLVYEKKFPQGNQIGISFENVIKSFTLLSYFDYALQSFLESYSLRLAGFFHIQKEFSIQCRVSPSLQFFYGPFVWYYLTCQINAHPCTMFWAIETRSTFQELQWEL